MIRTHDAGGQSPRMYGDGLWVKANVLTTLAPSEAFQREEPALERRRLGLVDTWWCAEARDNEPRFWDARTSGLNLRRDERGWPYPRGACPTHELRNPSVEISRIGLES
jgi:hypothetical protein